MTQLGRDLASYFSRRMLPLALVAGLIVALVPPLAYRIIAWQKLASQAQVYAGHMAMAIKIVADRDPYLWRFNSEKILQATALHRILSEVGFIRIIDCKGKTIFQPGNADEMLTDGVSGWAPVISRRDTIAFAEVRMAASGEYRTLFGLGVSSSLLGVLVFFVLFLFPTRVVKRQGIDLNHTLNQLRLAEKGLKAANEDLTKRVEQGIAETRRLSERVVKIQEEERRRIARDLHDSVGQSLVALQLSLTIGENISPETTRIRQDLLQTCDEALKELRRVVHELRPPDLDGTNLPEILRSYAERFEIRTGIRVYFRKIGEHALAEDVATCLLRILQETLTNIGRHAKATEVGIKLQLMPDMVSIEINDDGCGFDVKAVHDGTGLRGIRERCSFLGGSVEIESSPEHGTKLCVNIPLREGVV